MSDADTMSLNLCCQQFGGDLNEIARKCQGYNDLGVYYFEALMTAMSAVRALQEMSPDSVEQKRDEEILYDMPYDNVRDETRDSTVTAITKAAARNPVLRTQIAEDIESRKLRHHLSFDKRKHTRYIRRLTRIVKDACEYALKGV